MSYDSTEIRYASGEPAHLGDLVLNDIWESVVVEVISSPEQMALYGVGEPGLMLKCDEAGLVFEPCSSSGWDAVIFKARVE